MHKILWKLLRLQISPLQFIGFIAANLVGFTILLVGIQFYLDMSPVFTANDSFMNKQYVIISKHISAITTLKGKSPSFSDKEIRNIERQPFVEDCAPFTPSLFNVYAAIGGSGLGGIRMGTEMFFEAVPDEYIDTDLSKWNYHHEADSISIILPKTYLNLYNFGFAGSKGLPTVSEGLVSLISIDFILRGSRGIRNMKGHVVGFSDRINTILVPQAFLDRMNKELCGDTEFHPARYILNVTNPADERIAEFLQEHNYEAEAGSADAGKTTFFLRIIISIVLAVGMIICLLSFYVLLLSIFMILQRHKQKIQNLLLIGYSVKEISRPFTVFTTLTYTIVTLMSVVLMQIVRNNYLPKLEAVYPKYEATTLYPTYLSALTIFLLMCIVSQLAIRRRIRIS